MISSEDVRHVTFDKAFQGYRREDVDDYLKQVAQAMDDLAAQNDDLQKKLVMLAQRIEKYRTMENSLSTSMINAQRMGENVIREANQKAEEIIHRANLRGDDIIRDANELLQKASDRADEIENEANEKRLAEEREYDRVRLEVTRFKADVLNLYRSHVESLSRLPEFQKDAKDAEKDAPAQDAEPAQEAAAEQPAAQPETAPAADAAAAPAEQPAEPTETTEPAAPADDDKAADSNEDFWAKDESQLKLDPPPAPPADFKPDEPDYDAFQGVKFSE